MPTGHDGIRALPPQQHDDLQAVFVYVRPWKNRSNLFCHPFSIVCAIDSAGFFLRLHSES